MDTGLRDLVVLVTGASGAIGRAIARALAAEGAVVAAHAHTRPEAAERLAEECGRGALAVRADLREESQADAMVEQVLAAHGRLDAVVANAGIWVERATPLHEMPLAQWNETLASDLTSAFLTCRAFLRHLAASPREEASIVLVGSTAALFGEAHHADYAAAKAALVHGLMPSLKNEIVALAPRGRVNAVCPGWVETPMAAGALADPATVERILATMPLRKVATPEDVAAAVTFLTSPRLAGHLSGVVLPVAGGMEGRVLGS